MNTTNRLLTTLVATSLALAGCAGGEGPEVSSEALVGGAQESGYASTGYLLFKDGIGQKNIQHYAFCTGTLIAPDVVVTAGHCLDDEEHEMVFGVGTIEQNRTHRIRSKIRHPGYQFTSEIVANDVAVLHLETPVNGATVAKLGKAKVGSSYRTIGYGQTVSDVPTFSDPGKGLRKSASIVVTKVKDSILIGSSKKAGQCYGDSGGPLMVEGKDEIVGIMSSIENEKCAVGDDATYMSIDAYRTFIEDAKKAASSDDLLEQGPSPAWTVQLKHAPGSLAVNPKAGGVVIEHATNSGAFLANRTIASYSADGGIRWSYETSIGEGFEVLGVSPDGTTLVNLGKPTQKPVSAIATLALGSKGEFLWNRVGRHQLSQGRLFDLTLSGTFAEIDPRTGQDTWRQAIDKTAPNEFPDPTKYRIDSWVVAGVSGQMYAISESDEGTNLAVGYNSAKKRTGAAALGILDPGFDLHVPLVLPDGSLVAQENFGPVSKFLPNGDDVWSFNPAEGVGDVLVADPSGKSLFTTDDPTYGRSDKAGQGLLASYDARTGQLQWKKTFGAVRIAFGKNGDLFIVRRGRNSAYDADLVALRSDGTERWAKSGLVTRFSEIATDGTGSLYVTTDKSLVKFTSP